MRKAHAGIRTLKVAHLLPPRHLVTPEAVREDDHRALTREFVMDLRVVQKQAAGAAGQRVPPVTCGSGGIVDAHESPRDGISYWQGDGLAVREARPSEISLGHHGAICSSSPSTTPS